MDDQNQPADQPQDELQKNEEISTSEEKEIKTEETETSQEDKIEEGGKTRLEKRIDTLQKKLEGAKTEEDKARIASLIEKLTEKTRYASIPKEPLIRPEDLEAGVDPQELERRQQLREFALKEEIKQELQMQNEIISAAKDHMSDYEQTIKANPELDPNSPSFNKGLADYVTRQYFLANSVYNPMTGKNEFVPLVKTSQIVNEVKNLINQERIRAQAEVKGRMASDIQNSAVPPTSQPQEGEVDLETLKKDLWSNPRKVAEYLEKKLK